MGETRISTVTMRVGTDADICPFEHPRSRGLVIGGLMLIVPDGEDGVTVAAAIEKCAGEMRCMALVALADQETKAAAKALEVEAHYAAEAGITVEEFRAGLTYPSFVRRDELKPGMSFHSSHGFDVHVERVLSRGETTTIWGRKHSATGAEHIEISDRDTCVRLAEVAS